MFSLGQIVYSKKGRDKGSAFIVVDLAGEYLYLADGLQRKLNKPKKKKIIHVQITKDICLEIKEKLESNKHIDDAELRKALMLKKEEEVMALVKR